jgi:hypothetical protein
MRISFFIVMLLTAAGSVLGDGNALERVRKHEARMSFLDNGVIRIGVDLNLGGSITWLSKSGSDRNLVNSWDFGRQIQMSYYSGPVPFAPDGKRPKAEWEGIGWNPIQVGDAFGNSSKLREEKNDGTSIYVKCVPMHWPLDNVPGECTFECWLELEGSAVHARCRMVNDRPDHTQWQARGQELPAIYTNGPWYKLMTYEGDAPFTNGPLSRIEHPFTAESPWAQWTATENWAALVDDDGSGVGVWEPGTHHFSGGFAGQPGKGDAHDNPTGYIAPGRLEIIDWNIEHEYRYDLIVGKLAEIRKYVYERAKKPRFPRWTFEKDRAGWWYVNAVDGGWPIKGELNVKLDQHNPQLTGPVTFFKAEEAGTLVIEAACHAQSQQARIYWRGLNDTNFSAEKSVACKLDGGEQFKTYRVNLAEAKGWDGAIVQVRIDPDLGAEGHPGDWIRVRRIEMEKSRANVILREP